MSVPKFGKIAVDLGYMSPNELAEVLTIQEAEDIENQPHRPIGAICMRLGYLSLEQVETVLERQALLSGVVMSRFQSPTQLAPSPTTHA